MFLPLDADLKIRYWSSPKTFNYISRADDLARAVEILIAPPSPRKPQIMQQAISEEFEAIGAADEVFVLGYSVPRTDQDQWNLISRAVRRRKTKIRILTVVNFNASVEYFDDIRELFQPQTSRTFNDGFAAFSARQL